MGLSKGKYSKHLMKPWIVNLPAGNWQIRPPMDKNHFSQPDK